jgi:hypothetical protein
LKIINLKTAKLSEKMNLRFEWVVLEKFPNWKCIPPMAK